MHICMYIHFLQEGSRGVCQAKEYYKWFKQSMVGNKGCLVLISFLDMHIVVSPSDIKFCEDACMA